MCDWEECEMARKLISLCERAASRRFRKVFSANGQPQWRRKTMIVGVASSLILDVGGAFEPIAGGGRGSSPFGANQEESSWVNDMLIKGSAIFK